MSLWIIKVTFEKKTVQFVYFFTEILTGFKMQVSFHFFYSTIELLLIAFGMLMANEEVEWIFEKVVTGGKSFRNIILFSVYFCKHKMGWIQ